MGQKHEKFREFRTPFPQRDIRKNPRGMYARVPQAMAQFVLKIELLSHIMGTTPILEIARAYGLRPRLWLLIKPILPLYHFHQVKGKLHCFLRSVGHLAADTLAQEAKNGMGKKQNIL